MKETKKILLPLALVAGLVAFYPSSGRAPSAGEVVLGVVTSVADRLPLAPVRETGPEPKSNVPALQVAASAVLVRDVESGISLFSKNSEKIFPIASLTKLMTALVVDKLGKLDDIVEIQPSDEKVSEFRAGFKPGQKFYASDLVKAMLIGSANDAAFALARHTSVELSAFAREMNLEAGRLGMYKTSFTNPAGFDDANHYSTAEDLARLVDEFLTRPDLRDIPATAETVIASVDSENFYRLQTTNRLLGADQEVVGLKTGYTYEARGNLIALVSHEQAGQRPKPAVFYSIILGSDDREGETEKVLNWVRSNFVWK